MRPVSRACSAGFKPAGWLASQLTESLFMSCYNSISLSQQSARTVFFSAAEQVMVLMPDYCASGGQGSRLGTVKPAAM